MAKALRCANEPVRHVNLQHGRKSQRFLHSAISLSDHSEQHLPQLSITHAMRVASLLFHFWCDQDMRVNRLHPTEHMWMAENTHTAPMWNRVHQRCKFFKLHSACASHLSEILGHSVTTRTEKSNENPCDQQMQDDSVRCVHATASRKSGRKGV